jgi:hypothetical protein
MASHRGPNNAEYTAIQWNKPGDHPAVFADYISGPCGDVDTGDFFLTSLRRNRGRRRCKCEEHIRVIPTDWIVYDGIRQQVISDNYFKLVFEEVKS